MTDLERLARALASVSYSRDETYDGAFLVTGDSTRYSTLEAARAALAKAQVRAILQELREPSEGMLSTTSFVQGVDEYPKAMFQDMIDHILLENQDG